MIFRNDIHRLRGIAILLIVATHCVTNFSWNAHPASLEWALDLFDNSTLIFVFISGYLFQHAAEKFHYFDYLKTKFRNVLVPYVIAATPGVIYALLSDVSDASVRPLFLKIAFLFIYGGSQMNYALWFIPVICIYYLMSPFFHWLSRHPRAYLALILLIPASILIHRPSYNHGHNLALAVYFLPVYMLGMFCNQFDKAVTALLDHYLPLLFIAVTLFIVGHFFISDHHGNYSKASLSSLRDPSGWIDWMFIQKMLLTFLLWGILRRFNQFRFQALDLLAQVSFTVYFFHLYVLFIAVRLLNVNGMEVSFGPFVSLLMIAMVGPTLLAVALKLVLPRWSRTLVGS